MDDLDANFDDDDNFDLIGILEKAEQDYSNTQQQRSGNTDVPDNVRTHADTTSFVHSDYNIEQQQHATIDQDSDMPESSSRLRSNWNPTLQPTIGFGHGEVETSAGTPGGSVNEYMQYEYKQDTELETALRVGAKLRSELAFKVIRRTRSHDVDLTLYLALLCRIKN
ncbi:hypothetical protein [Absidia glauca]|uniref:Uncharacterized protein n=1 Tax=Absidia glauca TaxID=4829 RepID=A0A163J4T7_ABSGL|nr:hypothetical protein [Absidia glauca]